MRLSKNLLLRNNFNSTIVKLAEICQKDDFPSNYALVMEEFERHMRQRIMVNTFCLEEYRVVKYPK